MAGRKWGFRGFVELGLEGSFFAEGYLGGGEVEGLGSTRTVVESFWEGKESYEKCGPEEGYIEPPEVAPAGVFSQKPGSDRR